MWCRLITCVYASVFPNQRNAISAKNSKSTPLCFTYAQVVPFALFRTERYTPIRSPIKRTDWLWVSTVASCRLPLGCTSDKLPNWFPAFQWFLVLFSEIYFYCEKMVNWVVWVVVERVQPVCPFHTLPPPPICARVCMIGGWNAPNA